MFQKPQERHGDGNSSTGVLVEAGLGDVMELYRSGDSLCGLLGDAVGRGRWSWVVAFCEDFCG